ncbi:MAG: hypothetical protein Kow0069_25310 [Promethearchaeota archaeon]
MLKGIFFIDEVTGILLHSEAPPSVNHQADLVAGTLKALQMLLGTTFPAEEPSRVRTIQFEKHRVLYAHVGRRLLVVGFSDGETPESEERAALEAVGREFYRRYERQVENFSGNALAFRGFRWDRRLAGGCFQLDQVGVAFLGSHGRGGVPGPAQPKPAAHAKNAKVLAPTTYATEVANHAHPGTRDLQAPSSN